MSTGLVSTLAPSKLGMGDSTPKLCSFSCSPEIQVVSLGGSCFAMTVKSLSVSCRDPKFPASSHDRTQLSIDYIVGDEMSHGLEGE